jgi:hypothetical protein
VKISSAKHEGFFVAKKKQDLVFGLSKLEVKRPRTNESHRSKKHCYISCRPSCITVTREQYKEVQEDAASMGKSSSEILDQKSLGNQVYMI